VASEARYRGDGVLFVERANELVLYGWISYFRSGSAVKARLNRRTIVVRTRPEARRAIYEQGEFGVKSKGGPNPRAVQHSGMICE
jgi:hypothetical protein